MTERPPSVRIDDLADPKFPADVEPIIQMLREIGATVSLTPDALMTTAVEQTGLDDFGDPSFEARLDLLCEAIRDESGYGPHGIGNTFAQLTGMMKNRLLIEDTIKQHPEILDIPIARPIIICGLPRTGTTHLHNLISADPALRSLPYWESLEPVLPAAEQPAPGEPDPRLARTEAAIGFINSAMPLFKRMHEMTVDHVHEEIQLLAIDVSTMLFETMAPIPSWRNAYLAADQTPRYAYLKRILQVLTFLRGGTRWVLKSPQHLEQFGPLAATFPDATFVVTHRDPVSVTASVCTMLTYSSRLSQEVVDPVRIGGYWSERTETMLRACTRDRENLPAAQTIDVRFDEFMRDDIAMVERIYELAGQPMTDTSRASMQQYMRDHPRGRFGGVLYDLNDFKLSREERREALQFYVDRFGVALEAPGAG